MSNVSVATRQKMSASRKAVAARPEMRRRYAKAIKAGLAHPEVRKRMSEAAKAAQALPGVKQRMLAARKIADARPDVKQRRSESRKIVCVRPDVIRKMAEGRKRITVGKRHQKPCNGRRFKGVFGHGKSGRRILTENISVLSRHPKKLLLRTMMASISIGMVTGIRIK